MIKKRRILGMLLVCCMLLTMMPASAWAGAGDTFQVELTPGNPHDLCTYKILTPPVGDEPGTVQIGDGSGPAIDSDKGGVFVIPKEVVNGEDRYIVTEIGREAFIDCDRLEGTLTIPNTITKIQDRAFWGCDGVIFSYSSVVGDGLTGLHFEAGSALTEIGDGAFYNCNQLGWYLEIPASVKTIGVMAFSLCSSLERVMFDEDGELLSIGAGAFGDCTGIGEELVLPKKLASIGESAFSGCLNLNVLRFTGNDPWTEANAFYGTNIATVCIPNSWSKESYPLPGVVGVFTDVDANRRLVKAPAIAPASLPEAVLDQPYTYAFTASGSQPITWSIVGNTLGLGIDSETGVLSGKIAGEYGPLEITIFASNDAGDYRRTFNILGPTPPAPTPAPGGGGGGSSAPLLITKIDAGGTVTGTNVDRLVKEGKALTVEGKSGEKLVFDTETLKNINGQTKDNLKVEIKDVSTDHNNKLPGKLVISLTLTAGGKKISNFGTGTATISLPYELKEGEKAEDVTVWYLAEDGTMSEVPCSYDPKTKMATFKVNHFSLYVVGTDALANWVNPFGDIKESHWFYEAIRFVSANKLMQGTTDTTFDPKGKTTRGMIVTTLWRMENQPKAIKESTFADVKSGKYYHDAVVWAAEQGIVSGYSPDKFGPEDKITREQLAVILQNYAAIKGYKTSTAGDLSAFSDAGAIHKWGKEAMAWASGEGLINGTGNSLLDPSGTAERSQVAAILQRFVEKIAN